MNWQDWLGWGAFAANVILVVNNVVIFRRILLVRAALHQVLLNAFRLRHHPRTMAALLRMFHDVLEPERRATGLRGLLRRMLQ